MRGVSATSGGLLPVVSSKIVPSALPARLESRQVDFCSMIEEYTKDAPPKDVKMTKEMRVRDLNEIVLFGKLYTEFKTSRTGAFSEHQLESLRAIADKRADRHEALATSNVTCALSALTEVACSAGLMRAVENISGTPAPPDVGAFGAGDSKAPSASELTRFQRLSQALPEVSAFIEKSWGDHTPRELIGHMRRACTPHPSHADWLAPIFAHMTYRQSQSRFHEFMIAVLGATAFDGAELWLRCGPSPGSSSPELHMVAAVHRTAAMQRWISSSTDLRLAVGSDIPGKVVADGKSLWQDGGVKEESVRAGLAQELDVRGAIGVPLAGLRGPCGALVFYCEGSARLQAVDPLLVQLLEKAVTLITSDFGSSAISSDGVGFEDWLKSSIAALEPLPAASSSQSENPICATMKLFPELESKVRLCRKIVTQRQVDRVALAAAARAKSADQKVAAAGSASALAVAKAGKMAMTKNCKLNATLKRKWICTQNYCHSPSSAEEDYLGEDPAEEEEENAEEKEVVGDKRKAPSRAVEDSDSEDDLTEEQVLAIGRGVALPAKKAPAPVPVVKPVPVKATAPPATTAVKTTAAKPTVASVYAASAAIITGAAVLPTEKAVAVVGGSGGSINEDLYSDAVVSAARALANFGNFQWGTFLEGSGIGENSEGYESIKLGSDTILDYAYSADGTRKRKYDRSAARVAAPGVAADGGALPVCLVDGCEYCVENAESLYCATHRGTRRCQKDGCGKCAQGATKYCIAHGGGRRCTYPGCFKGARDKLFCAAHGGGKRCTFESCTKSAVGGSLLCTAHGGGKRCKFEGCNKSSQSSTDYCVKHGGGRSCMFKGCNKVHHRVRCEYQIQICM